MAMPTLTFLLDTNAVIALEPYAGSDDAESQALADFLRLAREHGHHVVVHPANSDDLRETSQDEHRQANLRAVRKYELIGEPQAAAELTESWGHPDPKSNNGRDLRLVAAVAAGAATHLVTNDLRLIRRAARAGLEEQMLRPAEALSLLQTLHPADPAAPPQVRRKMAAALDLRQPIFDSLRIDYPEFDDWIRTKVAPDPGRRVWVVEDANGEYRAIAIVKLTDDHPLVPARKPMKISTFKVDERSEGEKLGELLLKTVLGWASTKHVKSMFVTVIKDEAKYLLVHFLENFGFEELGRLPEEDNEWVFEKELRPRDDVPTDPLAFHIKYGPPAISSDSDVYVVPIQPQWYGGLFPDSPREDDDAALFDMTELFPFGNALRKAYLSNANLKDLPPGALLLFYRSAGGRNEIGAVRAVGVVERAIRSSDPSEVLAFVGRRTVYSADEVGRMCQSGVIAVLFRQDRFLEHPWDLNELIATRVLNGPPQAIMRAASEEGREWVLQRLSG